MFVIGTAGHIDHGKSALVERITGIDPDRLLKPNFKFMRFSKRPISGGIGPVRPLFGRLMLVAVRG